MKIITLKDEIAEEVDRVVARNKGKFRSRANFVNDAVIEKVEQIKKGEYTEVALSQLLKNFPKDVESAVMEILNMAGNTDALTNSMDFLIDAKEVAYFEGNKEDICKKIKETIINTDLIEGAYLILFNPNNADNISAQIIEFLRALDSCIPERAERKLEQVFKNDLKEIQGRLIIKLKKEELKKE